MTSTAATAGTVPRPKLSTVIFVLGAPGSGKGTQCARLSQHFNFDHLSAGDLIRKERDTPGSKYGQQIADAIREPGKFVPGHVTCELINRAMNISEESSFFIDGFPINSDNLEVWEKSSGATTQVPCVLFLEVPEHVSISRCLNRRRMDDTETVLQKRFISYLQETKPVVEYYRRKGLLRTVDGTQEPSFVFQNILQLLPFHEKVSSVGQIRSS